MLKKGTAKDNKIHNYFQVTQDNTGLFNPGAIFEELEILGYKNHGVYSNLVCDNDLPEGLEMLYKRNGKTIYRCQFTDGELRVVAKN